MSKSGEIALKKKKILTSDSVAGAFGCAALRPEAIAVNLLRNKDLPPA